MGRGSYTASDWSRLRKSRSLDSASSANQIFLKNEMDPRFDPRFIAKREARDSEEHPNSTPIMIGVDVTGSMGYLSTQIIKESLNELMQKLYSSNLVQDPQLLFAAIGDARTDFAPLQVTQFESDIRIAEQLLDLWIENRGGDAPEDYQLLWYFAKYHTDIDSFNKRGKKGYCFTIGDADFHEELEADSISKVFGDKQKADLSSKCLAEMASEQYEIFHIHIGGNSKPVIMDNIIPGRIMVVNKDMVRYLPEIIISAIQITNGMDKKAVVDQWGDMAKKVVARAISDLCIVTGSSIKF